MTDYLLTRLVAVKATTFHSAVHGDVSMASGYELDLVINLTHDYVEFTLPGGGVVRWDPAALVAVAGRPQGAPLSRWAALRAWWRGTPLCVWKRPLAPRWTET